MSRGIWVSDTEFVRFSEGPKASRGDMATHMATRLRAGDLSGMFGVLPNPDIVLRRSGKSLQVYREMASDTMIKSGLRRRRAAVVSMEHGFDRESEAPQATVQSLTDLYADLPIKRVVRELVEGGYYGYAVAEVIWGRVGGLVVPVDLVPKPQEWFAFDADNNLVLRDGNSLKGVPVPARKFIVVGNNRTYANPYGEPDAAPCFWPAQFRKGGLKFWVTFCEKYGMPWAVGKQPRSASQADADKLADKLEAMVRDAVAVIPDDASVDLLQATTTANADMYEQLLMYCSREINIALLGNNQSTEKEANRASAQAASGVEDVLRDDDADMVAGGLTQVAKFTCEVNWPSSLVPDYEFWEQEDVDERLAKRDEALTRAGVRFKPVYYKRMYGLQDGDIEEGTGTPASGRTRSRVRGVDQGGVVDVEDVSGRQGNAQFAEGDEVVPPDQVAIDEAIAGMPTDALQSAMETMLAPALEAIGQAKTPDEVMVALAEAFPKMDSSGLEELLTRAFFVADLVGRSAVVVEAKAG